MINLNGRKVWGTGYVSDGKVYGDIDWKNKIKNLVEDQQFVIVKGRYGEDNLDYHYNIKGHVFSLIEKNKFLKNLDKINVTYFDNVFLYDAICFNCISYNIGKRIFSCNGF